MRPLPNEFTFDDNSTLTSFTDLREQTKGPIDAYYAGVENTHPRSIGGSASENTDCRSEDNHGREDGNSERDGSQHFRSKSSSNSGSGSNDTSSKSSTQFWATLSAYAASAAITSSTNCNHPNSTTSPEAAANAAAESLLADSQAMGKINMQRLQRKQQQHSNIATKPPMKITNQTVRNAASKASIAVLQSGADQEVAAAVASVILREGARMLGKKKANDNGSISSRGTTSASSSASTVLSSPLQSYSKKSFSIKRRKKKKSNVVTTNRSPSSPTSHSSSHSSSSSMRMNPIARAPRGRPPQEDDATIQSISTSKFGNDKYIISDLNSIMSDSVSNGSMGLKKSAMSNVGFNDNRMTEEVLNAVRAAVELVKNEDQNSVHTSMSMSRKSTQSSGDVGLNGIRLNEEVINAVREAMAAVEQKEQKLDNVSLTETIASTLLTQRSQCQDDRTLSSSPSAQEEALSTSAPRGKEEGSNKNPTSPTLFVSCQQENILSGMEMPEKTDDNSTIDTESHHKLLRLNPAPSVLNTMDSSLVESMTGNVYTSYKKQQLQSQPSELSQQNTTRNNVAEHQPRVIGQQQRHQLEEEREFEKKEANFRAAMELLQNKLNELECCDASRESSDNSSRALVYPPLASKRPMRAPPQQYQQLQQLSTLGNPAMSAVAKTTSSTCTPTMANPPNAPTTHGFSVASSTSTHYPPLPPLDTLMSVDTEHHGYESQQIGVANTFIGSGSSSTGGGRSVALGVPISTVDSGWTMGSCGAAAVVLKSSSSVRSVLKKPSRCFPIIEMGDEMGPDWEEDGAVFTPMGECRIGHTFSKPGVIRNNYDDDEEDYNYELEVRKSEEDGSYGTEVSLTIYSAEEEDENAVEVVLVTESNPKSPTARLKRRFREFFRRKSKKVTFNMNHQPPSRESSKYQLRSPKIGLSFFNKEGGEPFSPVAAGLSPTAHSTTSNKSDGSFASRSRTSMREAFLKTLRRGRIFKSSSSKAKGSNDSDPACDGAATATPAPAAVPSIPHIESTSSSLAVLRGKKRDSDSGSTPSQGGADPSQLAPEVNNSDNARKDSDSDTDAGNATENGSQTSAIPHPTSSIVRNDTQWLNSFADDISSKYTSTSDNDNLNNGPAADDNEGDGEINIAAAASTTAESYSRSTSGSNNSNSNNTTSSSSDDNTRSRFAPYKQKSIYIGDVIQSMPTFSSTGLVSEEGWVESVLNKLTAGELNGIFADDRGEGNDDATATSSAKSSVMGYNFT